MTSLGVPTMINSRSARPQAAPMCSGSGRRGSPQDAAIGSTRRLQDAQWRRHLWSSMPQQSRSQTRAASAAVPDVLAAKHATAQTELAPAVQMVVGDLPIGAVMADILHALDGSSCMVLQVRCGAVRCAAVRMRMHPSEAVSQPAKRRVCLRGSSALGIGHGRQTVAFQCCGARVRVCAYMSHGSRRRPM